MRSVLTALCFFASTAHAVPAQFTHQGRLLDADGEAREGDATITFRVTDSESGGAALWEETLALPLTGGFYAAVLGADEDNPLDTDVLSQAPVWLELQLDGEPAMFPRSSINAVPYATMATVAEEVSGGPVDATEIAVDGTPVVNASGEWVGPAPTVSWADLEGVPEDFADGVDDDTDTDTDSFAALGTSCLDGDVPVWDAVVGEWACDMDQDMLASIGCMDGQLIAWSGDAMGWVCADDADTMLSEDDVDAMVSDNGYAMATDVFSGSFLDLVDVAPDLTDGDDDTQLTADEVDAIVADNGYAMATDVFSGSFSDLTGVPDGLDDGDQDTLTATTCEDGQVLLYNLSTGVWDCGYDNDTTLSSPEVRAMVEAVAGLALDAGATVDGSAVLTETGHGDHEHSHHSAISDGLHITPASVALSDSDTQLTDGQIDLGSEGDDALTGIMVQTLTGGGDADTLHTHAASSDSSSGRINYLGVTTTLRAADATLELMEDDCAAAFGAARMCTYSQIKNSYPAPRPESQAWLYVDNQTGDGWNINAADLGDTFENSLGVSVYNRYTFDHNAPLNCTSESQEGAFVNAFVSYEPSARASMPALTILPSGRLNRVNCGGAYTVACCGPN